MIPTRTIFSQRVGISYLGMHSSAARDECHKEFGLWLICLSHHFDDPDRTAGCHRRPHETLGLAWSTYFNRSYSGCNDSCSQGRVQLSQATTSSARLHCSSDARPAPLSNGVGAGPDNDAAEAHRVPGRHRRRHEGASGRCRRDRGVREATDWPKRCCNTMLRHLERW